MRQPDHPASSPAICPPDAQYLRWFRAPLDTKRSFCVVRPTRGAGSGGPPHPEGIALTPRPIPAAINGREGAAHRTHCSLDSGQRGPESSVHESSRERRERHIIAQRRFRPRSSRSGTPRRLRYRARRIDHSKQFSCPPLSGQCCRSASPEKASARPGFVPRTQARIG
jgi:hypothetical protein